MTSLLAHPSGSRPLAALASLGLPVALLVAFGLGVAMMGAAGCVHVSPTAATAAATVVTLTGGALLASLGANVARARRTRHLAESAAIAVEDDERLADVERLATTLGVPTPALLAVVSDKPLAVSLLGRHPAILVSTWVFDHLDQAEWEAVIAHELAHQRPDDTLLRWLGAWLLGVGRHVPGMHAAWSELDAATEEAADRAALAVLDHPEGLQTARAKFGDTSDLASAVPGAGKVPLSRQLAIAALGAVVALPLVPFVAVPVCMAVCAP